MANPRTSRIEALFSDALDVPEHERDTWLARHCGDDRDLLEKVTQLLAADRADGAEFLARPLLDFLRADAPRRVGSYIIENVIGEGGMGEVYAAVHGHTGRRAAVKLLRAGIGTRKHLERFRMEAETLGRLNEPGIAQLYDAGIAEVEFPDGARAHRPFLAMELIPGRSVTEDARSRSLSIRDRLSLMEQVARAVQHAHMRGVIHRDLKPGNILVTPDGVAKIVDFGIARLIDAAESGLTVTGQVLGTVRYMSPEQASGDLSRVDTRTDVYALGAILYELLADRPLIESDTGSKLGATTSVLTAAPTPLSTIRPALAGNVEAVVKKAIERDVTHRYQSAAEFADDLRRLLNGEPVTARSPTTIERFARAVRRNRPLSAAVAIAIFALVSGTAVSVWQTRVARAEAIRANEEAHKAHLAGEAAERDAARAAAAAKDANYRRAVVESSRDAWLSGVTYTRELIAASARTPETRAAIRRALADTLAAINETTVPQIHIRVAKTDMAAEIYEQLGDDATALAIRRESLAALERELGPDNQLTIMERGVTAALELNDRSPANLERVERTLRECREKLLPHAAPNDRMQLVLGQAHASALRFLDRKEESAALYQELINLADATDPGGQLPSHIRGLLGVLYLDMGRPADAEPLVRAAVDWRVASALQDSMTATYLDHLGSANERLKRDDRAKEAFSDAVATWRHAEGNGSFDTAKAIIRLARTHRRLGENETAAARYSEVLSPLRLIGAPAKDQLILALGELARTWLDLNDPDRAEPLVLESLELVPTVPAITDGPWYRAQNNLALLHLKRGQFVEAEKVLLHMHTTFAVDPAKYPRLLREIASELVQVYTGLGRPEDANTWRERTR